MMVKMLGVAAAAVVIVALIAGADGQSANCIACLCQASTGCNATIGCSSHAGYHCGPFLLSYAFWADAGKPLFRQGDNPDRKGAFEECANDIYCAADTVVLYGNNFKQDCSNDGEVTCIDYGLIHKVGGYGCNVPIPQNPFFDEFVYCLGVIGEM